MLERVIRQGDRDVRTLCCGPPIHGTSCEPRLRERAIHRTNGIGSRHGGDSTTRGYALGVLEKLEKATRAQLDHQVRPSLDCRRDGCSEVNRLTRVFCPIPRCQDPADQLTGGVRDEVGVRWNEIDAGRP